MYNRASIYNLQAKALHRLNRPQAALVAIDRAIELKADNDDFLNTKGVILMAGGMYAEAAEFFNLALKLRILHLYLFNRATALVHLKRFDEAEDSLSQALGLVSAKKNKEEQKTERKYRDCLQKLRNTGSRVSWWTWWFDEGSTIKKFFGGFLLFILSFYLIIPLFRLGSLGWLNSGRDWSYYIMPTIVSALILILPVVTRLGPQGIEINAELLEPEVKITRDFAKTFTPTF